jgi:hypothetical protein
MPEESTFIDLSNYNPDDIPEGKVHPDGTEVNARISRISKDIDKNGTPYLMPWFEDAEDPNVEDWNDYLPLPQAEETEKENGRRLRRLKAFDEAYDLGLFNSAFDLKDAKSASGWQIVGVSKGQNGEDVNKVKKYVNQ